MPSSGPLACPAARRASDAAACSSASASSNELKACTRGSTALVRVMTALVSSTAESFFDSSWAARSTMERWKSSDDMRGLFHNLGDDDHVLALCRGVFQCELHG